MVRNTKQANVIHQPRGGKGTMKLHPIMTIDSVIQIEEGQSHGMINSSHQLPMEIIAIVIKK